ncbi:hypothetical protein HPP92_014188 [Vanilla planifolia]|uniref:TPX2 C-terminal domain-containing protein n=1 Tax=Vanilla planifolia TaxID=51239 RepID=A0A835QZ69_VANPL|nr:hypothetical protein HPP92_014188 [Vanilla planifolia]
MERMKREDAKRRNFKAQPVMKDDPIPLPDRERKPLIEIQVFALHVDHRAVERTDFNQMVNNGKHKAQVIKTACEGKRQEACTTHETIDT